MSGKNKKSESSWKLWVFAGVIFAAVLLIFGGFTWVILENFGSGEADLGSWANAGAAYGILASLFTGLAFAGLIVTILLQREDLSLQREELKETRKVLDLQREQLEIQSLTMRLQQFETTFFNLLNNFKSREDGISFYDSSMDEFVKGSRAFDMKLRAFSHNKMLRDNPHLKNNNDALKADFYKSDKEVYKFSLGRDFIDEFYGTLQFLFIIVDYISDSDYEKNNYFRLINANLSKSYFKILSKHLEFDLISNYDEEKISLIRNF